MRRLATALLISCFSVGATAGDSCAPALRLGADAPELRHLADAWRGRRSILLARLTSPDADERRGAARLCAMVGLGDGMTADALLTALVASSDGEVQRLGAFGLLGHLEGIAPARLLKFSEPFLVCELLADHPAHEALDDEMVQRQLIAWLQDSATCEAAAVLITRRGAPGFWEHQLVQVIATAAMTEASPRRDRLVATAHQALCVLTRTQRGLAPYVGYYDLLAKDWRDALAEKPVTAQGPADGELLALISQLPEPRALRAILSHGPAALPALDQAMAGAERTRRRQLQVAARLVARAVTPRLYEDLGAAGLEGMDAEATADRVQALALATEVVLKHHDAPGLLHLVTYLDDHDTVVRTAALDRLVRLSDERKRFGGHWTMSNEGCFPPGQCLWRLRRSLKQGGRDEQVAALQFIASLQAKELSDDVVALLLSPTSMVVETALETLAHLEIKGQLAMLTRLATDRSQPALRRAKILDQISTAARGGDLDDKLAEEITASLQRLIADETDSLVLAAARKAQFQVAETPELQRATLAAMIAKGGGEVNAALRLIAEHPFANNRRRNHSGDDEKPAPLLDLAMPFLFHANRDLATMAATALVAALDGEEHRPAEHAVADALFPSTQRRALAQWCTEQQGSWPMHLTLAVMLHALPRAQAVEKTRALSGTESAHAWQALIATAPDTSTVLDEILAAQRAGSIVADAPLHALIALIVGDGLLNADRLAEVLAAGALDALPKARGQSDDREYDSDPGRGTVTRVVHLSGGRTLRLTMTKKPGAEDEYDDSAYDFAVLKPAPAHVPDGAALRHLIDGLTALTAAGDVAAYRDLAISVLAHSRPADALSSTVSRYRDLWLILLKQDPTLRPLLISGLQGETNAWGLRSYLQPGNPDLLPTVVKTLVSEEGDSSIDRFIPYLASLDNAALAPQLPGLLADPRIVQAPKMRALLSKLGQMPITLALPLLTQEAPQAFGIAPYGEEQLPEIGKAFASLTPEAVLTAAPLLRKMREAAPAVFDRALITQLDRRDVASAAWLRTNLPWQAGLKSYYTEALSSPLPELWMVGAAIALKGGTLSAHDFLAKVASLPPTSLGDAALVATRYLSGKVAGEGALLASILAASPERALGSWLNFVPPDPALAPVLAARAADPTVMNLIALVLTPRFHADRAAWLPIIQAVVKATNGKLDYLLSEGER